MTYLDIVPIEGNYDVEKDAKCEVCDKHIAEFVGILAYQTYEEPEDNILLCKHCKSTIDVLEKLE